MDHSINTLTAAIKSLTDGVQPAVDRTDPLATQQLALVIDYLKFLRERIPYLNTRARIELRAAQELAWALRPHVFDVDAEAGPRLDDALNWGEARVTDVVPLTVVEEATARILAVVREIARSAAEAAPAVRCDIARAVLEDSERMSDFYRSWYLPTGFDPYPDQVRDLEDIVAGW